MKWDSIFILLTLYKSFIELNIDLLDDPILPIVQFPFYNATADDLPTKTEKSKVLHSFKAYFKVLTTHKEPVTNIIDGIVQLYVLSHIPYNVQGVTEMVFSRLPKPSRDDYVTDVYLKKLI